MPEVGQHVRFVDSRGNPRPAIVTNVFGQDDNAAINVVFVNADENQTDDYGRKIERSTSVLHKHKQPAHGMYWEAV